MIRIGLIDYFLDQYHAVHYPGWLRDASCGEVCVTGAWALIDKPGGKSNAECCANLGIMLYSSPEEVIADSDGIIVMAPDHPEMHERLCQMPLSSGKPTYVDKTFAPDRASALRLVKLALKSGTPFFSASALRFAPEYAGVDTEGIVHFSSRGPGRFYNYGIHQLEPIVALMGTGIARVLYFGCGPAEGFLFQYGDGRTATITHLGGNCEFNVALCYENGKGVVLPLAEGYYPQFIRQLVAFFQDLVPRETVEIITALEAGKMAMASLGQWVPLSQDV